MKKILSDGTEAKIGQIVRVLAGSAGCNSPGIVTEIIGLCSEDSLLVKCKGIDCFGDALEYVDELQPATPQEIVAYTYGRK